MARGLIWTDPVLEDIEELATELERYSSAYSVAVVRALRKQAERLPLFPLYGRIVPEWDNPAFREIIVFGRYKFIYQVETDSLLIVTVQDVRTAKHPATQSVELGEQGASDAGNPLPEQVEAGVSTSYDVRLTKDEVLHVTDELAHDSTVKDILHGLHVREQIKQGMWSAG